MLHTSRPLAGTAHVNPDLLTLLLARLLMFFSSFLPVFAFSEQMQHVLERIVARIQLVRLFRKAAEASPKHRKAIHSLLKLISR